MKTVIKTYFLSEADRIRMEDILIDQGADRDEVLNFDDNEIVNAYTELTGK